MYVGCLLSDKHVSRLMPIALGSHGFPSAKAVSSTVVARLNLDAVPHTFVSPVESSSTIASVELNIMLLDTKYTFYQT